MSTEDMHGLVADVASTPSVWGWDTLWTPLVSGEDTAGRYSILEQLLARTAGPPPHVHVRSDEVFYLLDGVVRVQLGESVFDAHAGQLVRVPRNTPHGFAVVSETARFLNFYAPAAVDQMIAALSTPATEKRLPTAADQKPPSDQQQAAYRDRLVDLESQVWTGQADLLTEYRDAAAGFKPGGPTSS
ncbi:MAG TPA: cupin domain-containing protein [Pseudonocardia sp.]